MPSDPIQIQLKFQNSIQEVYQHIDSRIFLLMDPILQNLSFPFLMISLIFIFLVLRLLGKNKSTEKLPPGPWKLPLIGSIHHLIFSLPHRRLTDLAKTYGPIMSLQLGQVTTIVISSPETAREVLKTHDISFAERPRLFAVRLATYNYSDILFSPFGDYWRQMRKICIVELFSAKRVESFRSIREEQVSELITSISCSSKAQQPVNISKMILSMTYSIVSRSAFGKVWEGGDTFMAALKETVEAAGGFPIADLYPSLEVFQVISRMSSNLERSFEKFDKLFQSIINEHRARRAVAENWANDCEDFADVLLSIQEKGNLEFPLTDENIKAVIMDIFVPGIETSSTTIEWTMSELLRSPRTMKKVQEEVRKIFGPKGIVEESRLHELNYLKLVVKEALRLHPPAPLIPRECREKCVINGYEIPEKSKVFVNVWAIGRDANHWKDADVFSPERFLNSSIDYKGTNYEYLPFGSGRKMCPGIAYGMADVEFPLAQLLYHYDWKLPSEMTPESLDMDEALGIAVRRKNDLWLMPISNNA